MIELLGADGNLPFAVALLVMLIIGVIEGVGSVLGAGLSGFLDSLLPDLDLDADAPDIEPGGALTRFLGWLRVGRVPVLMLLVVFLTAFGLLGLAMQSLLLGSVGFMLPGSVSWVPALLLSLPVVRLCGGWLAYLIPRDESEAVSTSSFVGRMAVITLGSASAGHPAEAKLRDAHGHTHYVMVEPHDGAERFEAGTAVLLVETDGVRFRAIRNESSALID